MRISDWSSDVCSSDLYLPLRRLSQYRRGDPRGSGGGKGMRPFTYSRAASVEEAAKAAASTQGARFIAGGPNLLDLLKLQIEMPTHLIDVNQARKSVV